MKILIVFILFSLLFISGCKLKDNRFDVFCKSLGYNKSTDSEANFILSCPRQGCDNFGVECDGNIINTKVCGVPELDKWGKYIGGHCELRSDN